MTAFENRGVMLDLARLREKRDYYYGLLPWLRRWGYNILHLHFTDDKAQRHGCRFFGDKGMVHVDRGRLEAEPESLLKVALRPEDEHLYESNNHHGNFLECIRTRRDPVSPVEAGHAATTLTIVSDIATRLGRKVTWDWKAEKFIGDEAADRYLSRPMRPPWSL